MSKRLLTLLLVLSLVMCLGVTALADNDTARLTDNAGLLAESEIQEINSLLDEISSRHDFDVTAVTANTLNGLTPLQYAENWIDNSGFRTDRIVLLISMEEWDYYISPTWGKASEIFTDSGIRYIGDEFVPLLSRGDYAGAIKAYAGLCDDFLTQAENAPEPGTVPAAERSILPGKGAIILSAAVGLLTALIGTGRMKAALKSVRRKGSASDYVREGSLRMHASDEVFLYNTVNRTARVRSSPSSAGHSGGGGRSGGGGKF